MTSVPIFGRQDYYPKNKWIKFYLNVNSIRNKFVTIQELIKRISETKIDDSFPNAQFKIKGYKSLGKIGMTLEEDFSFTLIKS